MQTTQEQVREVFNLSFSKEIIKDIAEKFSDKKEKSLLLIGDFNEAFISAFAEIKNNDYIQNYGHKRFVDFISRNEKTQATLLKYYDCFLFLGEKIRDYIFAWRKDYDEVFLLYSKEHFKNDFLNMITRIKCNDFFILLPKEEIKNLNKYLTDDALYLEEVKIKELGTYISENKEEFSFVHIHTYNEIYIEKTEATTFLKDLENINIKFNIKQEERADLNVSENLKNYSFEEAKNILLKLYEKEVNRLNNELKNLSCVDYAFLKKLGVYGDKIKKTIEYERKELNERFFYMLFSRFDIFARLEKISNININKIGFNIEFNEANINYYFSYYTKKVNKGVKDIFLDTFDTIAHFSSIDLKTNEDLSYSSFCQSTSNLNPHQKLRAYVNKAKKLKKRNIMSKYYYDYHRPISAVSFEKLEFIASFLDINLTEDKIFKIHKETMHIAFTGFENFLIRLNIVVAILKGYIKDEKEAKEFFKEATEAEIKKSFEIVDKLEKIEFEA